VRCVWDAEIGAENRALDCPCNGFYGLAFGPDGREMPASTSTSNSPGRRAVTPGHRLRTTPGARGGYSAAWAANCAPHAVLDADAVRGALSSAEHCAGYFYYATMERETRLLPWKITSSYKSMSCDITYRAWHSATGSDCLGQH
jgi:hypothetical protein